MNIVQFIKSHKDLNDLPFLVVYRTIAILRDMGILRALEVKNGMD